MSIMRQCSGLARRAYAYSILRNGSALKTLLSRGSVHNSVRGHGNGAMSRRQIHMTPASQGVADSLRAAYDTARGGADERRNNAAFDAQMLILSDQKRVFDGNRYLDYISAMKEASGLTGFKEHLPWVQNNPALGELKDQQAVIYAMSPSERRSVSRIGIAAKKRISRTTAQSLDAVEAVMSQVETMRSIQLWLGRREQEGLSIPENADQLQSMITAPGAGMSRKRHRTVVPLRMRPGVKS